MTTYNEKSTDAAVNISSDDFEKAADATKKDKSTDPTKNSKLMDATGKGKVRMLQAKAEVDNTDKSRGMDKEMFCDPCQRDSKYKIAEGFCVDCDEHLCSSCFNIHRRFRVSQHHVLLDKRSIQENQTSGNAKDICVDRCLSHTDRVIEYFCQSCDKLCCSVCIIKGHRHCETVDFIPDIVENIEHSKVFLDVNETIHNQSVLLAERGEKCKIKIKSMKLKDSAKEELKTKCKEIRDWLNRNEMEMEMKIETKYTEEQQRFDMVSNEVTHLTNDLEKAKLSLTTKKNSSQRCQLFVALQKAKLTTKKVHTRLQEFEKVKTIQNYSFKEAPFLQDVKQHTELGILEEIKSDTTNVKFLYSFGFDKGLSGYPGSMCMMYDNILLLQSNSITMLNLGRTQQQVISSLKLNSEPADITKISQREVAVTFPDIGVITVFDVTSEGQIKEKQKIDAGKGCHGIQYFKKSFIVTYCHSRSGSAKIIDMSGQLIKELVGSSPLVFQRPFGLALNLRSGILYVSDSSNGTVTSLKLDGAIVNVYEGHNPFFYGLSLDANGSVYVCASCTGQIYQLSDKCSLVQILEIKINSYLHVLFSETNNLMYVSTFYKGINVFETK